MKTRWIVAASAALAVVLVAGAVTLAWFWSDRHTAQAQGPVGGWGMMGGYYGGTPNPDTDAPQGQVNNWGPMGMMGRYYDGAWGMPCAGGYTAPNATGETLTIDEALAAVEQYVDSLGYGNLEVEEVMEFTRNFYAIVEESDTGIGAMELLVDKYTGAVGPEYGPNMMWNAKYGMHRGGMGGMMGGGAWGTMAVSPEEALQIAQRWLDTYRPGVTVESHADAFYGYYTIHTMADGEVSGMLSVHGATGQVWYHNWHGDFIQMVGEEE